MMKIVYAIVALLAVMGSTARADNCSECEEVVQLVEGYLLNNSTLTQVEQALDAICQYVQGYEAVCEKLIDYGLQEAIQFIKENESPQTLCGQIGLCSAAVVPMPKKQRLSNTECDGCEQLIGYFDQWIASDKTEQQIEQALDQLCKYIPSIQSTCDQMVQQGVPAVINFIKANDNATALCQRFGVCAAKQRPIKVNLAAMDGCTDCKAVMGIVLSYLERNATISEIETFLKNNVCTIMPGFESTCDQVVDQLPSVVSILQSVGPDAACQRVGLCPAQAVPFVRPMSQGTIIVN